MAIPAYLVFLSLLILQGVTAIRYQLPGRSHHKTPFRKSPPYNIAHRGGNGEFPESTAPAFKRAIERGADFLETDIGVTKDGVLICIHDINLDEITDVKKHKEFADKYATYDLFYESGFFVFDFTLEEIKKLRVYQLTRIGDRSYDGLYEIITFEEYIAIAQNADRVVGIDPEIKHPAAYNQFVKWEDGKLFEEKYVEILLKYGYNASYLSKEWLEKPVFIQTFSADVILRIANQTLSPKVLNLGSESDPDLTDEYLDYISNYVVALSPDKTMIPNRKDSTTYTDTTDFVDRAHAHNLMVHAATFGNDPIDKASGFYADPYKQLDYYVRVLGVDGLMTEFPGTLSSYLRAYDSNLAADLWGN